MMKKHIKNTKNITFVICVDLRLTQLTLLDLHFTHPILLDLHPTHLILLDLRLTHLILLDLRLTQPTRLPLAMKSLYTPRAFVPEFYSRLDMCVCQSSMVTQVRNRTDDLRSTVKLSRLYDNCSDATITTFMAHRNKNKNNDCNCNFRLSLECLLLLVCCS